MDKSISKKQMDEMVSAGGASYAVQESWDIQQAANALSMVAGMVYGEEGEPDDVQSLANIMRSLMEFINGEIQEMVNAAKQGESYEKSTITLNGIEYISTQTKQPARVKESPLKLSYVKSLGVDFPLDKLAVKFVSRDTIRHPVFIWGSEKQTDLENEFFTRPGTENGTDFWDSVLGKSVRPLTWDHAQDQDFKADPLIGETIEWEDDELARWAVSKLKTNHMYRKQIDKLIHSKSLGSASVALPVVGASSDSAPQYIQRVQVGKSTWLARWPWFATALTPAPCEPLMIAAGMGAEFLKSIGVVLPDMRDDKPPSGDKTAWLKYAKMRRELLELNTK
jgi:hypothetical protein